MPTWCPDAAHLLLNWCAICSVHHIVARMHRVCQLFGHICMFADDVDQLVDLRGDMRTVCHALLAQLLSVMDRPFEMHGQLFSLLQVEICDVLASLATIGLSSLVHQLTHDRPPC